MLGWDKDKVQAFKRKFGLKEATFEAIRSIKVSGDSFDAALLHDRLGLSMGVSSAVVQYLESDPGAANSNNFTVLHTPVTRSRSVSL